MLSQTSIHVIRALIFMSSQPEEKFLGASAIARQISAPPNYLSKILQQFVSAGIIESQRGAGGGMRMEKKAEEVSLFEIVDSIEHISQRPACFMGQLCCGPEPCGHHAEWKKINDDFAAFLKKVKIKDLVTQNSFRSGGFQMPKKLGGLNATVAKNC